MLRPGLTTLSVAEKIEAYIKSQGAALAFPTSIAINGEITHITPKPGEKTKISDGDMVKVDVGAHVGGYIGDTAKTVVVGDGTENLDLMKTTEDALYKAIRMVKPGVDLGDIGGVIQDTASEAGFVSIKSLAGHSIEKYTLHGALTIPNVKEDVFGHVKVGDILAIEPFISAGKGEIKNAGDSSIYSFVRKRNFNDPKVEFLQHHIMTTNSWKFLPFSTRILIDSTDKLSPRAIKSGLKKLERAGGIHQWKIIKEPDNKPVAHFEHTLRVTKTGCQVLTEREI